MSLASTPAVDMVNGLALGDDGAACRGASSKPVDILSAERRCTRARQSEASESSFAPPRLPDLMLQRATQAEGTEPGGKASNSQFKGQDGCSIPEMSPPETPFSPPAAQRAVSAAIPIPIAHKVAGHEQDTGPACRQEASEDVLGGWGRNASVGTTSNGIGGTSWVRSARSCGISASVSPPKSSTSTSQAFSFPPPTVLVGGRVRSSGASSGGGVGRDKDWRRTFVRRATQSGGNRKVEFLLNSKCRETHEVAAVVSEATAALDSGVRPDLVEDGLGGTYFVKNRSGGNIAVFKPRDEEALAPNNPKVHVGGGGGKGMKEGILVGEAALNEYAAFLLDRSSGASLRAGVCPTALVRFSHSAFHSAAESKDSVFREVKAKVGSFQLFASHDCTAEDLGSSMFPAELVHRIAVLDIRLCNTDRHPGNILVRRSQQPPPLGSGTVEDLIPIDHGYALPGNVGEATFEWLYWPAAKQPFSAEIREAILALDSDAACSMLRSRIPTIREECLVTLRVCTLLLQHGVAAGLTAFDIGNLMERPYCRSTEPQRPSELESMIQHSHGQEGRNGRQSEVLEELLKRKCEAIAAKKD